MTTLFVEQLTVIDFSYFDQVRGIVGESWILDVELEGSLDANGMVFDFSHVKKQIKQHVDQLIDHKFVVASHMPALKTELNQDQLCLYLTTENGADYYHHSPLQAVAFIPASQISIAAVTPWLEKSIKSILPANVSQITIKLREENIDGPFYHYSHGLKHHFGDCQRIAHGHRSKIQVFRNQQRDTALEQTIAQQWQDIYLITREDLVESKQTDYYTVAYEANQGTFRLSLPQARCLIIDTDTTVELIAEYLAQQIKQQFPQDSITVRAFEGVQKGAIARA
ncbi:MAG: 6-carboxytetrahydropterin synthase [Gammaproteobacteria bacterium]|nr:6-carboxytetrahydropterin synthase [Gammaproteobacteria bacterium]